MRGYARAEVEIYILIDAKRKLSRFIASKTTNTAPEILKDSDIWQPAELPGLRLELAQLWIAIPFLMLERALASV